MKYFLFISDLIGFVALSISAVLVSLVSSVALSILRLAIRLLSKLYQIITKLSKETISTATKADTQWLVIRIGKFSILLGRKNDVSKPDS